MRSMWSARSSCSARLRGAAVGFQEAARVDGVPPEHDHHAAERFGESVAVVFLRQVSEFSSGRFGCNGEHLVAEALEVDPPEVVRIHDVGVEDLLDRVEGEGDGALGDVVAPLLLLREPLEEVQHGGVLVAVVLVERGHAARREGVIC